MSALLQEFSVPILGAEEEDTIIVDSLSQGLLMIKIHSEQKNYRGVRIPLTARMAVELHQRLTEAIRGMRESWDVPM